MHTNTHAHTQGPTTLISLMASDPLQVLSGACQSSSLPLTGMSYLSVSITLINGVHYSSSCIRCAEVLKELKRRERKRDKRGGGGTPSFCPPVRVCSAFLSHFLKNLTAPVVWKRRTFFTIRFLFHCIMEMNSCVF